MNKLILETNRILELMIINEAGPIPVKDAVELLVKSLSSALKAEDKQIIIDVIKGVATSEEKKGKFASLMLSDEGRQFVRDMETVIAKESDPMKRKLFSRELENLQSTARNWESLANKSIGEAEAKNLINGLTEEAKTLFNQIINDINNLKTKGLGKDIVIDINKINNAASAVIDGSITKSSDYLSFVLELKKLGIDLAKTTEEVGAMKSKQSGQNVQVVNQRLSMFNKVCNSIVDFIKGNKVFMWILKLLKKVMIYLTAAAIAITLLMKAAGYAIGKVCNSVIGAGLKLLGFCAGTSAATPSTETPSTETPPTKKKVDWSKYQ
jgi:hypothetical protein